MASAIASHARAVPGSRRLLAAFGDERLVALVRRGSPAAFEALYDRHHRALLSFCRHLLGSREDAEDAVQFAFTSAHERLHADARAVVFRPWLFTVARNRALSMLRARRPSAAGGAERSTAGLSEEVERREDLRALVADLGGLPERQRSALLLAELGGFDHREIAEVVGCEAAQVKALVFQARTKLAEGRRAREIPCAEVREQLAAGARSRGRWNGVVARHVRSCSGCEELATEVRRQRRMMALVLPVIPGRAPSRPPAPEEEAAARRSSGSSPRPAPSRRAPPRWARYARSESARWRPAER